MIPLCPRHRCRLRFTTDGNGRLVEQCHGCDCARAGICVDCGARCGRKDMSRCYGCYNRKRSPPRVCKLDGCDAFVKRGTNCLYCGSDHARQGKNAAFRKRYTKDPALRDRCRLAARQRPEGVTV